MEYEELLGNYTRLQNKVLKLETKVDELREKNGEWRYKYNSIKKQLHNAQSNTIDMGELERLRIANSKLMVEINYLKKKHRAKEED